ncbi:antitoxin MazE [Mammaliicoccus lentus]|uniref:type II toxin-antitoxin system antitoxin MazE n=1 Tax=Mammaliicoccus lentus TaxID=42858 RepID=UPI0007DA0294|nr:type II toxin-antitoxin system antitoxin MazE [Mammaliicoccus lentus]MCD2477058.1 antitoxin MazE [Mammaliicoccus lentus]MCD2522021.1 antitoxin MazE [Mammaliicoccus lentus]OAO25192.1 antitoxin MazE [Mammaliicoccus lentus]OAO33076.1 antitoxin MazE [Mammaliicoccus lentus]
MTSLTQIRNQSLEQTLKEGYRYMADLNLSLASEAYYSECEACDSNESHLTSQQGE